MTRMLRCGCAAAARLSAAAGRSLSAEAPPLPALCARGARCGRLRIAPVASARRRSMSSAAPPADGEAFSALADRAWRALSRVHDAVAARHSREALQELRSEAARPDLWTADAAHAARVVRRLAALEAREARAAALRRGFLDARELFALAREEHDAGVMRECAETMARVLADAQQMRVELLLQPGDDAGEGGDGAGEGGDNAAACLVEIQAGAGGQDSCDWVAMLARMYARWGETRSFRARTMDESPGVDGVGLRAALLRLDGPFAYGWAKAEAGVHRLVRVSPFDAARRRHTAFAQVRVYPVRVTAAADRERELPAKDLRVDVFRASGPGGQHVNSTDSAVRVTHLPSGLVAQSQSERSQHRNKAAAMDVLRAKLRQRDIDARDREKRQYAAGLGDNAWGSQIRSYVLHPYTLVKDHRTNYSETNVERVLDGHIDRFMEEMLLAQTSPSDQGRDAE